MSSEEDLVLAQAKADAARQQLTGTIVEMQSRLKPKALIREAVQDFREVGSDMAREGIEAVKQRPAIVAGTMAALGLLLARRPIARMLGRKSATERHDKS